MLVDRPTDSSCLSAWHAITRKTRIMKHTGKVSLAVLILDAFASFAGAGQVPVGTDTRNISPGDISPSSKTSFFANLTEDVPDDSGVNPKGNLRFRPFVSFPEGEWALPGSNYLHICHDFASWARSVIKASYVPSDSFIVDHLQLFPAAAGRRFDVAFVACQRNNLHYLIVQVGGLGGRIFFVTDRNDGVIVTNAETAQSEMMAVAREYVNLPSDVVLPGFQIEKRGRLWCLKVGYDRTKQSIFTHAQCIVSDHEIALSFWKWGPLLGKPNPAHAPQPDEWFKWEMYRNSNGPFPRDSHEGSTRK